MKLSLLSQFSFGLMFISASSALGAACCGGGLALPSLIVVEDQAQVTASYAFSEVAIDNVDSNGVWRTWDSHQQVQTLKFEAAHILSDRWQVGFVLPVVQRSRLNQNESGLGDAAVSLGYEYLPDWDYNPIRPKGIGFLQITLPTGKAKAESEIGGLDSRGNGFFALGLGTVLTKVMGHYDVFSSFEIHRSLEKSVNNSQVQGSLRPGFGGNFGLGGGYNTQAWRWGSSITWSYEDPINIRGRTDLDGSIERYATGVLSMSYLAPDEWAGTLTYADQTLFGSPINTSLGRTGALQLQKKWGR